MTPELLTLLQGVDTPTVCNAIEVAQGARGFDRFTRTTLFASDPEAPAMVGRARTARIRAVAPPAEDAQIIRSRRMAYYKYMSEAAGPTIAVVEDMDGAAAVGAFWGEINSTVHKGFGLAGTLTNGLMRDLADMAPEYPVLAGGLGPSHAFVHVTEIATPVEIFGMSVAPDEWVHADRHGALVIPAAVIPDLGAAIGTMQSTEQIVLRAARAPDFDFAAFEAAWRTFEAART